MAAGASKAAIRTALLDVAFAAPMPQHTYPPSPPSTCDVPGLCGCSVYIFPASLGLLVDYLPRGGGHVPNWIEHTDCITAGGGERHVLQLTAVHPHKHPLVSDDDDRLPSHPKGWRVRTMFVHGVQSE